MNRNGILGGSHMFGERLSSASGMEQDVRSAELTYQLQRGLVYRVHMQEQKGYERSRLDDLWLMYTGRWARI